MTKPTDRGRGGSYLLLPDGSRVLREGPDMAPAVTELEPEPAPVPEIGPEPEPATTRKQGRKSTTATGGE